MLTLWFYISAAIFYLALAGLLHPRGRAIFQSAFLSDGGVQSLDGLRGLSAFWVMVGHIAPFLFVSNVVLISGPKAVAIFAVLSGFLIYGSASKIRDMDDLRNFVVRRFFRIYPVYAISLILIVVFFWDRSFTVARFVGDVLMFRSLGSPTFASSYTWSVFPEVLFYAVIPAYVPFGLKWGWKAAVPAAILLSYGSIYGQLDFRIWQYFFVGIALADIVPKTVDLPKSWAEMALLAGIGLLALDLYVDWGWVLFNGMSQLFGTEYFADTFKQNNRFTFGLGVAAALIVFGAVRSSIGRRILSSAPLVFLGKISYSLFVLHAIILCIYLRGYFHVSFEWHQYAFVKEFIQPTIRLRELGLILLPSIFTTATISYLLIEKPLIDFSHRGSKSKAMQQAPSRA